MARIIIAAKPNPVRRAIHGMLAAGGHKVRSVDDGAAAVAALHQELADLVICDAQLPLIDGVGLMMLGRHGTLRGKWKNVRFLLMSDDPYLATTLSRIEVAVDGLIAKPFSTFALKQEVQRLLPIGSEAA